MDLMLQIREGPVCNQVWATTAGCHEAQQRGTLAQRKETLEQTLEQEGDL